MDEPDQSPLHYLSGETAAKTSEEISRLVDAVKLTACEFPDYFNANPSTKTEQLKKDIFILKATILYREGHAPRHHVDRLKSDLHDLRMKLSRIEITGG
ncbi:MAG TPA: hypothetical protein VK589_08580 [Chryseolinea sp.]|nr:hypothetical protein [Chryseolinea sp.]